MLSSHDRAFEPGTSGSAWQIHGQPAVMQNAAREFSYTEGFGQAMTAVLAYAQAHLGAMLRPVGGLDNASFRFVASF